MNELKKARQQLDERNGISSAKAKKAAKKKVRKQAVKEKKLSRTPRQEAPSRQRSAAPVSTQRRASAPNEERRQVRREVTNRRKKRRKKNRTLYYILLFLFISITGIVLSLTVFFNIDTITVKGNGRYSADEIIENCGIREGDNLFRISTGDAADRIIEEFEYIDNVTIDRSFPSSLVINVTEAKPVMSFRGTGYYYLVSKAGRILESGLSEPAENTFVVTGIDLAGYRDGEFISAAKTPAIETLQTINAVCEEVGFPALSRVDLNSVVDIRLYVEDRIRVDVGSITDLDYKLGFAFEIIDGRLTDFDRGVIDVKTSGTAYYRPAEDLTGEATPETSPEDPAGEDEPSDGSGEDNAGSTEEKPEPSDASNDTNASESAIS